MGQFSSAFDIAHAQGVFQVDVCCCLFNGIFRKRPGVCQILQGERKHALFLEKLASLNVELAGRGEKDELTAIRDSLFVLATQQVSVTSLLDEALVEGVNLDLLAAPFYPALG